MTTGDSWPPRPTFQRTLLIWFCSLLLAGMVLVIYFGMPWMPLLFAGSVTLLITMVRYWCKKKCT